MRAMLMAILTCAVLAASMPASSAFAQGRTRRSGAQRIESSTASVAPVCRVSELAMPGADIGAKINACDAALGADKPGGEIHVNGGGSISTFVNLSRGRTLWLHDGLYTHDTPYIHRDPNTQQQLQLQAELGLLRFNDGVTIRGDGWNTVIEESDYINHPAVIAPYIGSVRQSGVFHGGVTRKAVIRDLQIKGYGGSTPSNGTGSTVDLGNCHDCLVENVFLNQTTGNGITAGGSSVLSSVGGCGGQGMERDCASGVVMRGNRLFQVQNQGLNVVNGRDVQIVNNVIKDHNRLAGSNGAGIDIETNRFEDTAKNIRIANNMLDFSNSPQPSAGNGINVQSSGQKDYGPVEVVNNTLIGSALAPNAAGHMVFGIFVAAGTRHVTVANNTIRRTSNCGIIAYGSQHIIRDNVLTSVGNSGAVAVSLFGTTNSLVRGNKVKIDPAARVASDVIAEMPGSGANGNVFEENVADTPPRVIGAGSKVASHKKWATAAGRL